MNIMITYVIDDLMQSPAKVLVNAVNIAGVMGKGIAYDFKLCYPEMFAQYRDLCRRSAFDIGQLMLYQTAHKWVLNFPTKQHWRSSSQVEHIEHGLQTFVATYATRGITSASFPRLGTGAGGLDWERDVRLLMENYLDPLPIAIYIHEYDENDPHLPERNIRATRAWLEGTPKPVSFSKFWRDITRLLKSESKFTTLDGETRFSVGRDKRRKGHNLVVLVDSAPQPLFLSESLLVELWLYVRSAGYALTANLPGGLDEHADVMVALLAQLDYVRPVHLVGADGLTQLGLHYIPPTSRSNDVPTLSL